MYISARWPVRVVVVVVVVVNGNSPIYDIKNMQKF